MTEVVLDASVVLKWFALEERGAAEAGELRKGYEDGRLAVTVPSLLYLELLNVAGRRWGWAEEPLLDFADAIQDLRFEAREPDLQSVASWVARGLTAYDAAYVSVAEEGGHMLVTDDDTILGVAGQIARPLVEGRR